MEDESNVPKKRVTKVRVKNVHKCSEQAQLSRMRHILVGNGDPTTGLVYLVKASIATQKAIEVNISEIKDKVKEISGQYSETLSAAQSAVRAIEKYKSDETNFKDGQATERKSINQKRNMFIVRFIEIAALVVAIFVAIISFKEYSEQYTKNQEKIMQEIQDIQKVEVPK